MYPMIVYTAIILGCSLIANLFCQQYTTIQRNMADHDEGRELNPVIVTGKGRIITKVSYDSYNWSAVLLL